MFMPKKEGEKDCNNQGIDRKCKPDIMPVFEHQITAQHAIS
jgi:hypothetical protein